jgi:hypothetical protein
VARDKEIVIVSGARTPMAEWIGGKRGDGLAGGALASVSAIELGAIAAKAALDRAKLTPDRIDHVVMGNALQTSGDAIYGARHVALKAGVPKEVPALTVNRLCGSGLQSVVTAAQQITTGESTWVLAGGMENLSQAPHVIRGARGGLRLGQGQLEDSLMVALMDSYCGCYMAQTSDNLARKYGITREAQDEFALRSHTYGNRANTNGRFAEEVVPVEVKFGKKSVLVEKDDHLFPSTTPKDSQTPPAFGPESFVTAGARRASTAPPPCRDGPGFREGGRARPLGGCAPRERRRRASEGHGPSPRSASARRAGLSSIRSICSRSAGVRRAVLAVEGSRARPREGQCERRRDRARPSARATGTPHLYAVGRARQARQALGCRLRLHRWRPGHRRRARRA